MNPGEWLAIGLSAFFLIWFIVGAAINRQRGRRISTWLLNGLGQLGKVEVVKREKLMQAAAHFRVSSPTPPYTHLEAIYTLEPRENFPLWVYGLFSGRKDAFYLRADLSPAPPMDVEAGRKNDPAYLRHRAAQLQDPFSVMDLPGRLEIAWSGKKDDACLGRLSGFLQKYDQAVTRLSLQRRAPHLTLKFELAPLEASDPGELIRDLRAALTE